MKPGAVGHVRGQLGGGGRRLSESELGQLGVCLQRGSCSVCGERAAETQARACSQPLFSWGITQNTSKWGKEPVPSSSDGQRPCA